METQAQYGNKPPEIELTICSRLRTRNDVSWFEKVVIASIIVLPAPENDPEQYIATYLSAPKKSVMFALDSLVSRKVLVREKTWYRYITSSSSQ